MIEEGSEITRCQLKGLNMKLWFVRLGNRGLCNNGTKVCALLAKVLVSRITKIKQERGMIYISDVSQNFATRETIKIKEEVEVKDQKVQAKIIEIKGEVEKGPSEEAEAHQAEKKQR
jgi:hypothetical protein